MPKHATAPIARMPGDLEDRLSQLLRLRAYRLYCMGVVDQIDFAAAMELWSVNNNAVNTSDRPKVTAAILGKISACMRGRECQLASGQVVRPVEVERLIGCNTYVTTKYQYRLERVAANGARRHG